MSQEFGNELSVAAEDGHIEVVESLLEKHDPSADNNYAIRAASDNGHIEVVRRLLADGRVDPSADNNYALRFASRNGHVEVVELLLDYINHINLRVISVIVIAHAAYI